MLYKIMYRLTRCGSNVENAVSKYVIGAPILKTTLTVEMVSKVVIVFTV